MAISKVSRMRRMFSISSAVSEGFMPAARFIQQQDLWLGGQGADDLQAALGTVGQAAGLLPWRAPSDERSPAAPWHFSAARRSALR